MVAINKYPQMLGLDKAQRTASQDTSTQPDEDIKSMLDRVRI